MNKSFTSHYLDVYGMTPEHLRSVADRMNKDGVEYIEIYPYENYGDLSIEETSHREETPEELEARAILAKQCREKAKLLKKQMVVDKKINQIKSALYLKVKLEEPPVKTLTPDVYWVYKGCKFKGLEFSNTGFVRITDGVPGKIVKKEKDV